MIGPLQACDIILRDYRDLLGAATEDRMDIAGCQSTIVELEDRSRLMVIRGTDQWSDWARYNFFAVPWPGERLWWHKGFLNHAQRSFAFAKSKNISLVIGHSLGAAAAGIVGFSLGVPAMGFATPRALWSRVPPLSKVMNWCRVDDLVCLVPFGAVHLGAVKWLNPAKRNWGRDHGIIHYLDLLKLEETAG